MPQDLDQPAAASAKHEQVTSVRVLLERLLHQQRQPIEASAHVGVTGRQPNPYPRRNRDHRRRSPLDNAATAAVSAAGSTTPVIRIRVPLANSISIRPAADRTIDEGSATRTAAKPAVIFRRLHSCRRHPYNRLGWMPAARATADTPAPSSSEAATSSSFSAVLQRRRR